MHAPGLTGLAAAVIMLCVVGAGSLAGCGGGTSLTSSSPSAQSQRPAAAEDPDERRGGTPAAVISDREGPSWRGRLGDTVQVDWFDQASGESIRERIAVIQVKRVPSPEDDDPIVYGDDYGPYGWRYAIKVRLTSMDEATARGPIAYQYLTLSDGVRVEDGVAGLGDRGGPDPSRVGRSSVGWLYQRTEEEFRPTEVVMSVGPWRAVWSME